MSMLFGHKEQKPKKPEKIKHDSGGKGNQQGVSELSEHAFFREYRHCGVTVEAAINKLFWNTHEKPGLNFVFSQGPSMSCFSHQLRLAVGSYFSFCAQTYNRQLLTKSTTMDSTTELLTWILMMMMMMIWALGRRNKEVIWRPLTWILLASL